MTTRDNATQPRRTLRRRSLLLPLVLLAYLAVMAWVGRGNLTNGNSTQYFITLGVSLAVVAALHFALRRKEKLQRQRQQEAEQNAYGHYDDNTAANENSSGRNNS